MSSCTILLNTRAGALQPTASVAQMQQMAQDVGLDAKIIGTRSAHQMLKVVRELRESGAEKVAVAGGDGTVSKVVQVLAHGDLALGIIPQGTFNNFATALRLPMDLPSALRVLKEGEVQEVSLGKVTTARGKTRYFTESAGVGLFADALALYGEGSNKNFWRGMRAMWRVIASFEAQRLHLDVDGKTTAEHAVMCIVANTYRMAQALPVAPGARLTDDELDVIIAGDLRRGELISYYRAFRAQLHLKLPKVSALRGQEIHISAKRRLNVHCDDTIVGGTPVTISVQPRALKVLVDKL